jgi:adenylate cyclase
MTDKLIQGFYIKQENIMHKYILDELTKLRLYYDVNGTRKHYRT